MILPPLPSFSSWFQALWGYAPYPWQTALAHRVTHGEGWPDAIGVPTGAGKTASLDVALYALAAEAHLPPQERRAPRRIVLVVDRRTVVDQSFDRAAAIRDRLVSAEQGPLYDIAVRLRALMGPKADSEEPLAVALLRGGIPRDDGFARRPDQASVILSTVDQIGSRLLFRGYGVRHTMQSIHAGLLGNDTLFLLDEVHLARPFEETLAALEHTWRSWHEQALPDRWRFVRLSATSGAADALTLSDADRAHPALLRRMMAHKPISVHEIDTPTHNKKGPHPAWLKALVSHTKHALAEGASTVGVVVNRVDTARALAQRLASLKQVDVCLLTGRMRPCDRAEVVQQVMARVGPNAESGSTPFVCVATQCIEAGADLDFGSMVTELASLDALVQRFGRVNRGGCAERAPITICAPRLAKEGDPVYGDTLAPTLAWIKAQGEAFDASPASLGPRLETAPSAAYPARVPAAVMLPGHLDLLSQTSPVPSPDPDPAHYLRGLAPPRLQVQVVWRADITEDDLEHARTDSSALQRLRDRLCAVPPSTYEALALPIGACVAWLRDAPVPSFSDTDVDAPEADMSRRAGEGARLALRADGDASELIERGRVRPGSVLVVPATRGGLWRGNFDPSATEWVLDQGDLGHSIRSGRPTMRLDPRVHGLPSDDGGHRWLGAPPPAPPDVEHASPRAVHHLLLEWLDVAKRRPDAPPLVRALRRVQITLLHGTWLLTGAPLPISQVRALARGQADAPPDEAITGDEGSSFVGQQVSLTDHLQGVSSWARGFATRCGLPAALIEDLACAGAWHDLGKADPRFQVLLHDGDEIRAAAGVLLAKSGGVRQNRLARRRARGRARLPIGFRHESASVALLSGPAAASMLASCHDPELVLHLIASHHGWARPFAAVEDHTAARAVRVTVEVRGVTLEADGDAKQDRIDSGVCDRFWRLQRRYGWWGLAWLEALLRLADHRRSESESRGLEGAP